MALLAPDGLRITIHEGRNRQVRRMCEAVGHPVRRLVRTRIGPLRIGTLAPGEWRELTVDEVRALERAATAGTDGFADRQINLAVPIAAGSPARSVSP